VCWVVNQVTGLLLVHVVCSAATAIVFHCNCRRTITKVGFGSYGSMVLCVCVLGELVLASSSAVSETLDGLPPSSQSHVSPSSSSSLTYYHITA